MDGQVSVVEEELGGSDGSDIGMRILNGGDDMFGVFMTAIVLLRHMS